MFLVIFSQTDSVSRPDVCGVSSCAELWADLDELQWRLPKAVVFAIVVHNGSAPDMVQKRSCPTSSKHVRLRGPRSISNFTESE